MRRKPDKGGYAWPIAGSRSFAAGGFPRRRMATSHFRFSRATDNRSSPTMPISLGRSEVPRIFHPSRTSTGQCRPDAKPSSNPTCARLWALGLRVIECGGANSSRFSAARLCCRPARMRRCRQKSRGSGFWASRPLRLGPAKWTRCGQGCATWDTSKAGTSCWIFDGQTASAKCASWRTTWSGRTSTSSLHLPRHR